MSEERLAKLKDFLAKQPNDPFLKYAIATEYLKLNQIDKALLLYNELIEKHPNYVGTYYHLGKLQETMEDFEMALKTYEKGMVVAKQVKDLHSFSELQGVYNNLYDELNY